MREPFIDDPDSSEEEDVDAKGKHPLFARYDNHIEEYLKTKPSDAIMQGFVITGRNSLNPKVRRLVLSTTALRVMKMKKNEAVAEYPLSDILSVKQKSKVCFRLIVSIHKKKTSLGGISREEKIVKKKIVFETPREAMNLRWINEIKKACGVAYNTDHVLHDSLSTSGGALRRSRSISDPPTPSASRRKSPKAEDDGKKHTKAKKSLFGKGGSNKHALLKDSGEFSVDRDDPFNAPVKSAGKTTQQPLEEFFAFASTTSAPPVKRLNLSPRGTPPGSPRGSHVRNSREPDWIWDPLASPARKKDLSSVTAEEFQAFAAKEFASSGSRTVAPIQPQRSNPSFPPPQKQSSQTLIPTQENLRQTQQQPQQQTQGIVFSTMGVPHSFELIGEIGVVSGNATVPLPPQGTDYHNTIEQARILAQQDLFRVAQKHLANAVLNAGFSMTISGSSVSVLAFGTACVLRSR